MAKYRPPIPDRLKLILVLRHFGLTLADVEFDHCPPLGLREYDEKTRIYTPPANDPEKIVMRLKPDHRAKTHHPRGPHTSLGSDQHLINKVRPDRAGKFAVQKTGPKPSRPAAVNPGARCRRCGEYGEDCQCPPVQQRSSFRSHA